VAQIVPDAIQLIFISVARIGDTNRAIRFLLLQSALRDALHQLHSQYSIDIRNRTRCSLARLKHVLSQSLLTFPQHLSYREVNSSRVVRFARNAKFISHFEAIFITRSREEATERNGRACSRAREQILPLFNV
jgi:hypothetical protein